MNYINKIIIVTIILILFTGCNSDKTETTQTTIKQCFAANSFVPYTNGPILESQETKWDGIFDIDEDGNVDNWTPRWADPYITKIGDKIVMFVSAADDFPNTDTPPSPDIRIYRLESIDGINWTPNPNTPVFKRSSTPSDWDSSGTETPAVIEFQGKHHLFYTGYDGGFADSSKYKIGHATSIDGGITWLRDTNNPILSPSGIWLSFNESITAEPAPIIHNNQLYLYFTAVGANLGVNTTLQVIGLMKSKLDNNGNWDGATWTTPISVLEPDQKIYPRNDGWYGYTTPSAILIEGKIHLYFSVVNEIPKWEMINIHHASSNDGETNWTQDSDFIFTKNDFSWIGGGIHSPSPYLKDDKLMLFYTGHDIYNSGSFGIGVATCDVGE